MIIDTTQFFKYSPTHQVLFKKFLVTKIDDFTSFIEQISSKFVDDAALTRWLFSPLSERGINNPLYKYFCYLQVIEHSFQINDNQTFLVGDDWIKKYLLLRLPDIQISIKPKKHDFFSFLKNKMKVFYYFILKISQLIIAKLFIKKINFHNKKIIIVERFALPNFYNRDRYFPGIEDFSYDDRKIVFCPSFVHTNIRRSFFAFKELENSKKLYLFKEHYLGFTDIFQAFRKALRINKIFVNNDKLNQLEKLILSGSCKQIISLSSSIEAFINYHFINTIKNINVDSFINWWEGQPVDRGFSLGISHFSNNIKLKHYLGFIPKAEDFQVFPTSFELNLNICSNEFYTMGSIYNEGFKYFCNDLNLHDAPAFRFVNIYDERPKLISKPKNLTVMIGLPMNEHESINILNCIQKGFHSSKLKEFILEVRFHPASNINLIKKHTFFEENFQQTSNTIYDQYFPIFISGCSSLAFEAAIIGSSVFIYEDAQSVTYPQRYYDEFKNIFKFSTFEDLAILLRKSEKLINQNFDELDILKSKFFNKTSFSSVSRILN